MALAKPPHIRILVRCKREDHGFRSPCLIFPGSVTYGGYGCVGTGSRTDGTRTTGLAHRVVYEATHGPVPEGMVIDHLCSVRRCVEPTHLEAVTHSVNVKRSYERLGWSC